MAAVFLGGAQALAGRAEGGQGGGRAGRPGGGSGAGRAQALGGGSRPSQDTFAVISAFIICLPHAVTTPAIIHPPAHSAGNMAADDPLANAGRFFFGPLQQGRDGLGAVCCCGTNVIFRRDHLVAIGGQAYHCITEVSGQHLLTAHGFCWDCCL